MPKAILELEMPESCETCPIKRYLHYGWVEYICGITGEEITNKGRRSDCPLKLVERCEWILIDDDKGLWQCSKCGAEWVLGAGTPADNEMNYCPACGRRLEVEL
jgi:DNA-directed RNA polymerase subunit RPC12/RpoP